MKRFSLLTMLTALLLSFGHTYAETQSYREAIEGLDPMDLSDVDPKVAGILRKYYKHTFGDSLTWESVESLRVEGETYLGGRTLSFVTYRKKPNLIKMIIDVGAAGRLTFGYDGVDAWQASTMGSDSGPVAMPKAEALNLARDAVMG